MRCAHFVSSSKIIIWDFEKFLVDILLVDAQLEVCHNLFSGFDESFLQLLIPGVFALGIEVHLVPFVPTVSRKSEKDVKRLSMSDFSFG